MKILYVTIIAIAFIFNTSFTQNEILLLSIEDSIGRKDSVYFGFNENATIGIDTLFDEEDLFGNTFDTTEVRIVQYTELNHNCLTESHYSADSLIFYSNNIESKIDIRPYQYGNALSNNFEFIVKSDSYPINLNIEYIEGESGNPYPVLFILGQECNQLLDEWFYSWQPAQFILEDSSINTAIVQYEFIVPTNDLIYKDESWILFPNPNNGLFSIKFEKLETGTLVIKDQLGKVCVSKKLNSVFNYEIQSYNLNNGVYFVSFHSSINNKNYSPISMIKI